MIAFLVALALSAPATLPATCPPPFVCFSPGRCDADVADVIESAQHTLDIAVYGLNRATIVEAIVRAQNRGVTVRLIVDNLQSRGVHEREPLARIVAAGVPVKRNAHRGLMHDKVMISDGDRVVAGSYNWTNDATEYNDENVMVLACPDISVAYARAFERMWIAFPDFRP